MKIGLLSLAWSNHMISKHLLNKNSINGPLLGHVEVPGTSSVCPRMCCGTAARKCMILYILENVHAYIVENVYILENVPLFFYGHHLLPIRIWFATILIVFGLEQANSSESKCSLLSFPRHKTPYFALTSGALFHPLQNSQVSFQGLQLGNHDHGRW